MPSRSGEALQRCEIASIEEEAQVSMPSRSGEALQPASAPATRPSSRSFYALKVGRGVATMTCPRSTAPPSPQSFYALKVGRGVATVGTSS